MRLAVYPGGHLIVTAPRFFSLQKIENFILKKANWILQKVDHFRHVPESVLLQGTRKDFLDYKKTAYSLVQKQIEHFNTFYKFTFNKISIRNQTTRWGSCSKKGNLSFNYKIVLLPSELANYIIVHELCHLKEMNHSARFWELVSKTVANHQQLRKRLREIKHI